MEGYCFTLTNYQDGRVQYQTGTSKIEAAATFIQMFARAEGKWDISSD